MIEEQIREDLYVEAHGGSSALVGCHAEEGPRFLDSEM